MSGAQRDPDWQVPSRTEARYRALIRVVRGLLHLCSRRRTDGAELLPAAGPVIVVGNHLSVVDALVLGTAVARRGRRIRMLATAGVFRVPLFGALLRAAGFIPVHRWSDDPSGALAPARAALAAGQCVGLYPEGAITRHADLWPARGKTGVVRLALDTGAPVVPLAQWGTHRLVGGEGTRWKALLTPLTRPRIGVRVGAPIDLRTLLGAESAADATAEQLRAGADAVMAALVAELAVLRDEPAPPHAGVALNPPKPPRRRRP